MDKYDAIELLAKHIKPELKERMEDLCELNSQIGRLQLEAQDRRFNLMQTLEVNIEEFEQLWRLLNIEGIIK